MAGRGGSSRLLEAMQKAREVHDKVREERVPLPMLPVEREGVGSPPVDIEEQGRRSLKGPSPRSPLVLKSMAQVISGL